MGGQDTGRIIHTPDGTFNSVGDVGDVREGAVLATRRDSGGRYNKVSDICQVTYGLVNALAVTPPK